MGRNYVSYSNDLIAFRSSREKYALQDYYWYVHLDEPARANYANIPKDLRVSSLKKFDTEKHKGNIIALINQGREARYVKKFFFKLNFF